MKSYTALVRFNRLDGDLDLVMVPEGLRFWAAFFGPLWAFSNRYWLEGLGLVGLWMLMDGGLYLSGLSGSQVFLTWVGFIFVFGYLISPLQRWALERRGYVFWDVIVADDRAQAARRLFDRDGQSLKEAQA